jgi:hypothetical protein
MKNSTYQLVCTVYGIMIRSESGVVEVGTESALAVEALQESSDCNASLS